MILTFGIVFVSLLSNTLGSDWQSVRQIDWSQSESNTIEQNEIYPTNQWLDEIPEDEFDVIREKEFDIIPESDPYGFFDQLQKAASAAADKGCRMIAGGVQTLNLWAPNIDQVTFQFRTPCGSREVPIERTRDLRDEREFDANKKTVVFVTGWTTTPEETYVQKMAQAYHCRGGFNFLVVNTGGFIGHDYVNSAYHTKQLGEFVARGLRNLEIPGKNIHLIGHSLGAQIVGNAGRYFYNLTDTRIGRITGLDPARPCFTRHAVFPHLEATDADFVDVIHSNPGCLGIKKALGDLDFYPGGFDTTQSGCPTWSFDSHRQSIWYYIETIHHGKELNFMGQLCNDTSELEDKACEGPKTPMGFAADKNVKGVVYLEVNSESPYGLNDDRKDHVCGRCSMYKIN